MRIHKHALVCLPPSNHGVRPPVQLVHAAPRSRRRLHRSITPSPSSWLVPGRRCCGQYATKVLGLDLQRDAHLLWLAEEALLSDSMPKVQATIVLRNQPVAAASTNPLLSRTHDCGRRWLWGCVKGWEERVDAAGRTFWKDKSGKMGKDGVGGKLTVRAAGLHDHWAVRSACCSHWSTQCTFQCAACFLPRIASE